MIKVIDFLKVVDCVFEIYYKGSYIGKIETNNHKWLQDNYDWILECRVISIDVDSEDLLSIDTKP